MEELPKMTVHMYVEDAVLGAAFIFAVAGVVCGLVSLGYGMFTIDFSPMFILGYPLGGLILLGLNKLLPFDGNIFDNLLALGFWTMTTLQFPLSFTISDTVPLWLMGLLLGSVMLSCYLVYLISKRVDRKRNLLFTICVVILAYFVSILTLIDGTWSLTADLAAASVFCLAPMAITGVGLAHEK